MSHTFAGTHGPSQRGRWELSWAHGRPVPSGCTHPHVRPSLSRRTLFLPAVGHRGACQRNSETPAEGQVRPRSVGHWVSGGGFRFLVVQLGSMFEILVLSRGLC